MRNSPQTHTWGVVSIPNYLWGGTRNYFIVLLHIREGTNRTGTVPRLIFNWSLGCSRGVYMDVLNMTKVSLPKVEVGMAGVRGHP